MPSLFEVVPVLFPTTRKVTKESASPDFWSTTFPLTESVWGKTMKDIIMERKRICFVNAMLFVYFSFIKLFETFATAKERPTENQTMVMISWSPKLNSVKPAPVNEAKHASEPIKSALWKDFC